MIYAHESSCDDPINKLLQTNTINWMIPLAYIAICNIFNIKDQPNSKTRYLYPLELFCHICPDNCQEINKLGLEQWWEKVRKHSDQLPSVEDLFYIILCELGGLIEVLEIIDKPYLCALIRLEVSMPLYW